MTCTACGHPTHSTRELPGLGARRGRCGPCYLRKPRGWWQRRPTIRELVGL